MGSYGLRPFVSGSLLSKLFPRFVHVVARVRILLTRAYN